MDQKPDRAELAALFALLPADGSALGNARLHEALSQKLGRKVKDYEYQALKDQLVEQGKAVKGKGRGGSLARAAGNSEAFELKGTTVADTGEPAARKGKPAASGKKPRATTQPDEGGVLAYRHADRRRNNPEVGMVDPDSDPDEGKARYAYDPHLDPQLMWTGKTERTSFEIDTVSLHVHERIDPATILGAVQKRLKQGKTGSGQQDWLRAWFETPLPYREAIEFYKHDRGWANRLITGDSLLVMNSLLQKEGMAGQVQMIYIDPPYGIKYGSNFQPFVNKRKVEDRKDKDLTQEPETIKAFRDTWELGIHSYLTYLRDRFLLARELLSESGSIFVQISDENIHTVKSLLDEVFGPTNLVSVITMKKTGGMGEEFIDNVSDYLLWFSKSRAKLKFNPLFLPKEAGVGSGARYNQVQFADGHSRGMTKSEKDHLESLPKGSRIFLGGPMTSETASESTTFSFSLHGQKIDLEKGGWKTNLTGIQRLTRAARLKLTKDFVNYKIFVDDFPAFTLTNLWADTMGTAEQDKVFVVQTVTKVIDRCMLMSTDPGDLVLDPTCGSGTTAFVAERRGRRWITCDTSRVAITLAKQRLVTASFDYYELRYPHEGLKSGFIYKTIPHVTLKSIANNTEIDEIYERLCPATEAALRDLNATLKTHPPTTKFEVNEGGRKDEFLALGKPGINILPTGEKVPSGALLEWEVPFDFPEDWPAAARAPFDAFHQARRTMQACMDASIAAHADTEILYDQPEVAHNKLRVAGPFTVEAVPSPMVLSLDDTETPREADVAIARSGESSRHHQWRDELARTGIRGKGGQILKLADLETLPELRHLHCSGTVADTGERVVVSFGPEHAALEQRHVELAIREAGDLFPRPKIIVFCAFAFDPEAAKDIDATKGITALKAQMNTDLLTEDLKKARSSNQSFWLMGQPDVDLHTLKDGRYQVEVNGFDYFDTAKGELVSGGKGKIAAWALDTDYDERSLFPRQVFFPMAGAKDGWNKLRKDIKAELDESLLGKLHGTVSLPFEAGENRKAAVKIVDDRGIESLKIIRLE